MRTVRVGSRDSALAMVQSEWVSAELGKSGRQLYQIISMKTLGDQILNVSLDKVGGKGLFVKELESALLEGQVDLAVHSLKDVPTELPDGLIIGAVTKREDPRDTLVFPRPGAPGAGSGGAGDTGGAGHAGYGAAARTLDDLPRGARVGTSSLRRMAQVKHHRPDLEVLPVRGNVQTRLRKLDDGQFDVLVMAVAGLTRLGMQDRISGVLSTDISLPAVGQGALGLELRAADEDLLAAIRSLHDPATHAATLAERAVLRRLEGGCHVPIGALGRTENGRLVVEAMVAAPDGSRLIRGARTGAPSEAEAMGIALAEELLDRGAADILSRLAPEADGHSWAAPERTQPGNPATGEATGRKEG